MTDSSAVVRRRWLALALAALTLAIYAPVVTFDFVSLDDPGFVKNNPLVRGGFSTESLRGAFAPSPTGNWQPVTWMSHMLDAELFGLDARGHHFTSALLHAINAALLLVVLHVMTGALWRSAAVAALFALHPLHVESVAWIAERKDVLSTAFGLLALLAYAAWTRSGGVHRYLATCLCMALSLLSKATLVTLPFVLLLLDYWPLARLTRATVLRRVAEKLPLLALSIGSSVMTVRSQGGAGAFGHATELVLGDRIANAVWSYGVYLRKTVWPSDLAVYYPHPYILPDFVAPPSVLALASVAAVLVAATAVFAARTREQDRYAIVGWLWFLGTLVPMIGVVQIGSQALADRYTYVPLIGVFIVVCWGLADLTRPLRTSAAGRNTVALIAVAVLGACAVLSWRQLHSWRDGETLLQSTLAVTPRNPQMRYGLAMLLRDEGRALEAASQLRRALETWPEFAEAYELMGALADRLPSEGPEGETSIDAYRLALRGRPNDAVLHERLAAALVRRGDPRAALPHYRSALGVDPNAHEARLALARALAGLGRSGGAIRQYRLLIEQDPLNTDALAELANLLEATGDREAALETYRHLRELKPDDPRALRGVTPR
jgi:tetratricopeptide (TPR) repeat protein